jgi:prefoldin subunit 5
MLSLSDKIEDFLKQLKRHPEDYNMSEVMSELEDYSSIAVDLENEIQELKDTIDELEKENRELSENY